MNEKNQQAQILCTHFHRAYERDNANCDEPEVLNFQLRLEAVEAIRAYHMGKKTLDNLLDGLQKANELFRESGWPEIKFNPNSK